MIMVALKYESHEENLIVYFETVEQMEAFMYRLNTVSKENYGYEWQKVTGYVERKESGFEEDV